ncbi:acyl-CoA dehydrogenase family protein [Castellaniella sp. GW247-6E4]|uniref:acyl-CoA dehydrogenase family protein n=1 Tax=Castellaniella sp. GW247-6E4 TaxID=3140380 RepID=UPI003315FF93
MSTARLSAAQSESLETLVRESLAPQAQAIDREGLYPHEFLHAFGRLGGFSAAIPRAHGGQGQGLAAQIEAIALVGHACGSTAFLAWCQSACAWYLLHSSNAGPRERYLRPIAAGELLAGTGMSNAVKHLAGIERINLRGRREGDGYRVSGSLPWVSNIGEGHLIIVAAQVENDGYIMFAVPPGTPGLILHDCPDFAGLAGSGTFNVRLKDAFIPAHDVIAHPAQFKDYILRIKPGFVLTQIGIGLGIAEACLRIIRESNGALGHVNRFLDDQAGTLEAELQGLRDAAGALADLDAAARPLDILRARAHASELTLRAAQSAALHAGAKGYLMRHPAQRRLREALFVAIVTPALKHLRKEIHALEEQQAA